jgi:hypothetical protein
VLETFCIISSLISPTHPPVTPKTNLLPSSDGLLRKASLRRADLGGKQQINSKRHCGTNVEFALAHSRGSPAAKKKRNTKVAFSIKPR